MVALDLTGLVGLLYTFMNRLTLMVCPHDTARNPERWFVLAQHLSRVWERPVHLSPSLDFRDFHEHLTEADLIYANPQDSLRLSAAHGYLPIARAANLFDEVVFVAGADIEEPSLQDLDGEAVASVVTMLPTCLAISRLKGLGVTPSAIFHKESWLAVIHAVYKGQVSFGFVYRDYFDGLNELTRRSVQVIEATDQKEAFHMFLCRPELSGRREAIERDLSALHETTDGARVLEGLGMERVVAVDRTALDFVEEILGYCEGIPEYVD